MHFLIHTGALGAYAGSSVILARSLATGESTAPRAGAALGTLGVLLHVAGAAWFTAHFGELPLAGLGPSLSSLALLMALWVTPPLWLKDARPLGVVLMPLAAILTAAALLAGLEPTAEALAYRGLWFRLHVSLTMIGYACFAGAFAAALLYLLQHRELKGKHFGRMFRFLPPLDTLDQWQRRALEIGLPALTLGLLGGWAWTERFAIPMSVLDPKVVWGVLSWVLLCAALLGQTRPASRRRGALLSVVGFLVVVATYLVLRLSSAGEMFL